MFSPEWTKAAPVAHFSTGEPLNNHRRLQVAENTVYLGTKRPSQGVLPGIQRRRRMASALEGGLNRDVEEKRFMFPARSRPKDGPLCRMTCNRKLGSWKESSRHGPEVGLWEILLFLRGACHRATSSRCPWSSARNASATLSRIHRSIRQPRSSLKHVW
jgi:hypothetical protein